MELTTPAYLIVASSFLAGFMLLAFFAALLRLRAKKLRFTYGITDLWALAAAALPSAWLTARSTRWASQSEDTHLVAAWVLAVCWASQLVGAAWGRMHVLLRHGPEATPLYAALYILASSLLGLLVGGGPAWAIGSRAQEVVAWSENQCWPSSEMGLFLVAATLITGVICTRFIRRYGRIWRRHGRPFSYREGDLVALFLALMPSLALSGRMMASGVDWPWIYLLGLLFLAQLAGGVIGRLKLLTPPADMQDDPWISAVLVFGHAFMASLICAVMFLPVGILTLFVHYWLLGW